MLTRREDDDNRLGKQTARNERKHLGGHRVDQMRIVHETNNRHVSRGAGKETEYRQADGELVRRRPLAAPERDLHSGSLRFGEQIDTTQ